MIGNTRKHLEPLGSARKLWGRVKYCLNSKHIVWASGMFLFINIYINSHPPHSSNCHFTCPSTPSLIFDSPPPPIVSTLPSPTVSERNRAVPSGSECFRVFPSVYDHISTKFRAFPSGSQQFRAFSS